MNISIKEFLENWNQQKYDSSVDSMCDAGWYDWFCKDESLFTRLKKMIPKIKKISRSPRVNVDTMYVFFKNNDTSIGKYDDFRICDLETGDVLWTVSLNYPHPSLRPTHRMRQRYVPYKEIRYSQGYVHEVWDFVTSQQERKRYIFDALARGCLMKERNDNCVVVGSMKDVYSYFKI